MKALLLIAGMMTTVLLSTAQLKISAVLLAQEDGSPVNWAKVGVLGSKHCVLTDENGVFRITIPKQFWDDSLSFSAVGYEVKSLPLSEPIPDTIRLVSKQFDVVEAKVDCNWKDKRYGVRRHIPGGYSLTKSHDSDDTFEIGVAGDVGEGKKRLEEVEFYLKSANIPELKFILNCYRLHDTIPEKTPFYSTFKTVKAEEGWVELDFTEENIWMEGSVLVTLEFLPSRESRKQVEIFLGGVLPCNGRSYSRVSGMDEWGRLDFGTYSINFTVQKCG